jgi:hypothetical protein
MTGADQTAFGRHILDRHFLQHLYVNLEGVIDSLNKNPPNHMCYFVVEMSNKESE